MAAQLQIVSETRDLSLPLAELCQPFAVKVERLTPLQLLRQVSIPQTEPAENCILVDLNHPSEYLPLALETVREHQPATQLLAIGEFNSPEAHDEKFQTLDLEFLSQQGNWWPGLISRITSEFDIPSPIREFRKVPRYFGKVLCLDHNRRFSRMLQVRLKSYGLMVTREFNGLDGFQAAVKLRPDLIISEFTLPKALGSWVLGRLRDCEHETPMIFLSEVQPAQFPNLQANLIEMGATAVLPKPLNFDHLLQEIRKHISLPAELFPHKQTEQKIEQHQVVEECSESQAVAASKREHQHQPPAPHLKFKGQPVKQNSNQEQPAQHEPQHLKGPKAGSRSRSRSRQRNRH